MSGYALPLAKNRRATFRTKRKAGRTEFLITVTGGKCSVEHEGQEHGMFWAWLRLPRPYPTDLHTDITNEVLPCRCVSITPWLCWKPWRSKFIADDYDQGRRFVRLQEASEARGAL